MPGSTCGYSHPHDREYKCGEDVWAGSEHGFCIFHEPGKEKDVKLFDEGIKHKLKAEDYDFRGYVFPGNTDYFEGHKFEKTTRFDRAIFLGDATSFFGTHFRGKRTGFAFVQFRSKRTEFLDATFSGELTDFTRATFKGELTDFTRATFSSKRTNFINTQFSGKRTDFSNAEFSSERADFSLAQFTGALTDFSLARFFSQRADFHLANFSSDRIDFIETEFMGQAVIFTEVDLSRVMFRDFKLLNRMDLTDIEAWAKKKYYFGVRTRNTCYDEIAAPDAEDPKAEFKAASRTLGALERAAKANHNAALASDFAFGRKECDRRAHPNALVRLVLLIFGAGFFGWGEKLLNIAFSSVIVVFLLAFVFLFSGIHVKGDDLTGEERPINREFSYAGWHEAGDTFDDYLDCLYFSVVTFTTLGYGDMRPAGRPSKVIAMSESFLGAFTIAILAALYLRRLLT